MNLSQASGRRSNIGSEIFLGVVLMIVGSVTSMIVGTAIAIAMSGSGMPADPQRYLMSHLWPGLAVGMGIEALIGFGGYRWIVRKSEKRNPHELGGPGERRQPAWPVQRQSSWPVEGDECRCLLGYVLGSLRWLSLSLD